MKWWGGSVSYYQPRVSEQFRKINKYYSLDSKRIMNKTQLASIVSIIVGRRVGKLYSTLGGTSVCKIVGALVGWAVSKRVTKLVR